MNVMQVGEGVVRIEQDGRQFTGLATYTPATGLALTKLTGLPRENGWIIDGDRISAWHVAGFTQHEGRVYLYGDPVSARTLAELQRLDWDRLLPFLIRLARAFQTLEREGILIGPVHTRSILFTGDGGVLLLPETLSRGIAEQQNSADRMEFQFIYNHPDRSDTENRQFALAVLCYRSLTGVLPYTAASDDELRNLMRARPPLPAGLRAPELTDEVSEALQASLSAPSTGRLWVEQLRNWQRDGVARPLSDEQRIAVQARAVVTERRINRRYRQREFLRTNWQKMVVILLAVVLAGTVPGTIVRTRLQPRATAGMSPAEVVTAYFSSINRLDHSAMEDAVVDDAGRDTIRTVTSLYVMSRMRLAVEMNSGLLDAESWRASGSVDLPPDRVVYGVAGLEVVPVYQDDRRAEYLVRYEKWTPVADVEPDADGRSLRDRSNDGEASLPPAVQPAAPPRIVSRGALREDRVRLRHDGGTWLIYSIERAPESPVGRPGPHNTAR